MSELVDKLRCLSVTLDRFRSSDEVDEALVEAAEHITELSTAIEHWRHEVGKLHARIGLIQDQRDRLHNECSEHAARYSALNAEFDQMVMECFEVVSTTDVDQNGDHIERSVPKHHLLAAENERMRKALEACPLPSSAGSAANHYERFYDWYGSFVAPVLEASEATP